MVFRRRMRPVINSTKNIAESSGIIAATTNTSTILAEAVEASAVALSDANGVGKNCKLSSIYLSCFFIAEGGEVANEVPLVDWYIMKDPGGMATTIGFLSTGMPTPGSTGVHEQKRLILHTEKGLAGGGDASTAGVPMVFKGVIRIPKGMQTFRIDDKLLFNFRTNFATKFCIQAIYKWYT